MADHQVQAAPGQQIIDIVLPTYRMEPEEDERFYPSAAKAIAEKILLEELRDQVYDEEEAKFWSLNISDKVREAMYSKCLRPVPLPVLEPQVARIASPPLASRLLPHVDHLSKSRYKIVVQTTLGQMKDQGIRVVRAPGLLCIAPPPDA